VEPTCCSVQPLDGETGTQPCTREPKHHWGPLLYCCQHFDRVVIALYDLSEEVKAARHREMVRLYEASTKKSSRIEGTKCQDDSDG
jgi:hypothetical protein